MTAGERPALLVVGHGTRDRAGVDGFSRFVAGLQAGRPDVPVAGGFLELSGPPVADAVAALAGRGHRHIAAVPLVLVSAGHAKGDIPAALAREQRRHPGLRFAYGRPLGPHPVLLDLLAGRLSAALAGADPAGTAVLLVGRGSTDPDANAEVCKVARLFWEGWGVATVETAFVSLAAPGVPAGLDRCRALGARRVVVLPYFLFPGVLPDRVVAQAREWAAGRPEVDVRCATVLDGGPELAGLVWARYDEALDGDLRMNCDTCMYRVALPGFEHRLGAAQRPHHHPHDPVTPHPHAPTVDLDVSRGKSGHLSLGLPETSRSARSAPGADEPDLRFHGDRELAGGEVGRAVDLAVNVRPGGPPPWLRARLVAAMDTLGSYPDERAARVAVGARHGRRPEQVLLTAGAAEAFGLLARALRPDYPVVVHPQFTEPEAALRAAGHRVHRIVLAAEDGFRLDPSAVPTAADLVVVGNPTNPTSVLHPAAVLAALARPGRVLVVDEAFADSVPGEPESLAGRVDVPGLVVVRSLTKTWGLPGLRIGYLLAADELVAALDAGRPPWPVSSLALAAAAQVSTAAARREADRWAGQVAAHRDLLCALLAGVPRVRVLGRPRAPFVLLAVSHGAVVRRLLRARGFAVRRGDTFPGLGPDYLRVAVRDPDTTAAFVAALQQALEGAVEEAPQCLP